ncbi:MAG: hypothetical protein SFZ23_13970 [Planctomycetota bacterium]|nr:hypothetical protein [Planctomycetota bacterium]
MHDEQQEPERSAPRSRPPGAALSRSLGLHEDPTRWGVTFLALPGLRLRAHVLLLAWIAIELVMMFRLDLAGPVHVASMVVGALLVLVGREVARAAATRLARKAVRRASRLSVRGYAEHEPQTQETVMLWPLGAVTPPAPIARATTIRRLQDAPPGLWARTFPSIAGIAASVVLAGVAAGMVLALGGDFAQLGVLPWNVGEIAATLRSTELVIAWWFYVSAAAILAANLLPFAPFDLGRALGSAFPARAELARRHDERFARWSLIASIGFMLFVLPSDTPRLVATSVFACMVCLVEWRRAQFVREQSAAVASDVFEDSPVRDAPPGRVTGARLRHADAAAESGRVATRVERRPDERRHAPSRPPRFTAISSAIPDSAKPGPPVPQREPSAETRAPEAGAPGVPGAPGIPGGAGVLGVDEVLAKIAKSGMASLEPREREILAQETERLRRGSNGDSRGSGSRPTGGNPAR